MHHVQCHPLITFCWLEKDAVELNSWPPTQSSPEESKIGFKDSNGLESCISWLCSRASSSLQGDLAEWYISASCNSSVLRFEDSGVLFLFFAQQLQVNQSTHAVTRFNTIKLEYWLIGIIRVFSTAIVSSEILEHSSSGCIGWCGQEEKGIHSQAGPFHHNLWLRSSDRKSPLDAHSAAFSTPCTWFKWLDPISSTIHDTRFPK